MNDKYQPNYDDDDGPELCQRCLANVAKPAHPCPYEQDLHGDDSTLCNCCSECSQQCCDDL